MAKYRFQKLAEEKVFKDPIHQYIRVKEKLYWDLINTKEFQRLRRIKQLGVTSMTFHGAEHTRFGHSLGVYEITRRMLDDNLYRRKVIDADERAVALCAALLHDVGHGPFSHMFEKIFDSDHEHFTQQIILGDTEIHQVLLQVDANFPQQVADVISHEYENKLIVDLISSQIDADRMDYLQRDAYYTGVNYGQFDMERILRLMREKDGRLVIKESGIHDIEDYILGRYQMFWQVYYHGVSRGVEALITKLFQRAKELYHHDYQFSIKPDYLIPFFKNEVTLADYLALDEVVMQYYFMIWQNESDTILSDLSRRYLTRQLFKFKTYQTKSERQTLALPDDSIVQQLTALFLQVGIDPKYYLAIDSVENFAYRALTDSNIRILMRDDHIIELSEVSAIIHGIVNQSAQDGKIFYPKNMILQLPDSEAKREIIDLLDIQNFNRE